MEKVELVAIKIILGKPIKDELCILLVRNVNYDVALEALTKRQSQLFVL